MTKNVKQALQVLSELGFPRAQQNERSALCLLSLLGMTRDKTWAQASSPLMGITPIMDWVMLHYKKKYAPNTRETIRRQTMHQFVDAGLAVYNPDNPARPVNSPHAVYQIDQTALSLLRTFGSTAWKANLKNYLADRPTLAEKNARRRVLKKIPVEIASGKKIKLSPGAHSELIKAVIESFAPRFAPGCTLVYAGDTGEKWGYFDKELLEKLGVYISIGSRVLHSSSVKLRELAATANPERVRFETDSPYTCVNKCSVSSLGGINSPETLPLIITEVERLRRAVTAVRPVVTKPGAMGHQNDL